MQINVETPTNWQPWQFYSRTDIRFFYAHQKGSDSIGIYHRYDIFGSSPKIEVEKYLFTPVPMVGKPEPKMEYEYWLIENDKLCGILYDKKEADTWLTCLGRSLIEKERKERCT